MTQTSGYQLSSTQTANLRELSRLRGKIVSRDGDIVRSLDLMQQLETHGIRAITVSHFLQEIEAAKPSFS